MRTLTFMFDAIALLVEGAYDEVFLVMIGRNCEANADVAELFFFVILERLRKVHTEFFHPIANQMLDHENIERRFLPSLFSHAYLLLIFEANTA
jgi:hypothetical protein